MGLGPLEALLNDDEITEIMVNGPSQVYVERKIKLSDVVFKDNTHVMNSIIIVYCGKTLMSQPWLMPGLKDGSRFNAVIPLFH